MSYLPKNAEGFDPICMLRTYKRHSACNIPSDCTYCGWEQCVCEERTKAIHQGRKMKTENGLRYLVVAGPKKSKNKKQKNTENGANAE